MTFLKFYLLTRLRLQKEGQQIPQDLYTKFVPLRRGRGYNKIIEAKFYEQLQNGATLIIDSIDELSAKLDFFMGSIERIFKNRVQANAYMSWGNNIKGFTTHWDDHDVLILQVYGKKHWFVFEETRKYPLYKDLHEQHDPPATPKWDKIIESGDVLFIPRGQWHHAIAINEPSLHLTLGFNCRTGINYIQWIQDKLTEHEIYRKDFPAFSTTAELKHYHSALVEKLIEVINDQDLTTYAKDVEVTMENRPFFSLPWAASPSKDIPENLKVLFNTVLVSNYEHFEDSIKFSALDKQYEFSSLCEPIFKTLMDYQPHTFEELLKTSNKKLTSPQLEEVISSLVKEGLLAITE